MSGDAIGNAVLIALLAIVPLIVLMLTSFVKLSVVIALLRNAIGASDAPSGLVVMGLSLVLTFFVMAPVGVDMIRAAASTAATPNGPAPTPKQGAPAPNVPKQDVPPTGGGTASNAGEPSAGAPKPDPNVPKPNPNAPKPNDPYGPDPADPYPDAPKVALDLDAAVRQLVPAKYHAEVDAMERALVPLQGFLARHADARDRDTFVGLAGRMGRDAKGDELWVIAPAFLTTELREAFAIAVLIFVPFLVIDLVVGLGLAALGLSSTQPQTIALPLKLLLFVAVDGWRLLVDSLLRGYV